MRPFWQLGRWWHEWRLSRLEQELFDLKLEVKRIREDNDRQREFISVLENGGHLLPDREKTRIASKARFKKRTSRLIAIRKRMSALEEEIVSLSP